MSLIIKNLSAGSSLTIASGETGYLVLHVTTPETQTGPSRGFHVEWDSTEFQYKKTTSGMTIRIESWGSGPTGSGIDIGVPNAAGITVTGDLTSSGDYVPIQQNDIPDGSDGEFLHVTPAGFFTMSAQRPGIYYATLELRGNKSTQYCGLVVRMLPLFNLPLWPSLSWVPGNLIDLQVDFGARTLNSAVLSHCDGLKQGDDFTLAVVPKLAGTLIASGITAMSLTVTDRAHSSYAALVFVATGTPPTLTEVAMDATHQYYTITGNLRAAQIGSWFADLNKRIDVLAAADNSGQPAPTLPDRARLEALAQLHITTADGITTTQNFPFPILASGEVLATIGAASPTADPGVDLVWDFAGNNVIAQASADVSVTPPAPGTPLINVKEQDDLVVRLRLVKNGSVLAPTVTACQLILKELEPESQIVISDAFASDGSGDSSSVLVHAKFDGAKLAAALSNYEADAGTTFLALAEIELTYTNPFSVGPGSLVRTSKTFRVQIDRDLGDAA